jgi:hypothetical protein
MYCTVLYVRNSFAVAQLAFIQDAIDLLKVLECSETRGMKEGRMPRLHKVKTMAAHKEATRIIKVPAITIIMAAGHAHRISM